MVLYGAGDEARTRYLHLGKVALYRISYTRMGFIPHGTCRIIHHGNGFVKGLFEKISEDYSEGSVLPAASPQGG